MIKIEAIFNITTEQEFSNMALQIFKYQFENNKVYRSFCDLLYKHPSDVKSIHDIPFLPIQFFKTHQLLSSSNPVKEVFTSSGTTGQNTSKHYVTDIELYKQSFRKCFNIFYGDIKDYVILALLPSYLERDGSSLIYMINDMIVNSNQPESGFYLHDLNALKNVLVNLESQNKKTLLIGVSFALLDFVEMYQLKLNHTLVMETGGMKGRRKELIREELHNRLKKGFGVNVIHSEYGMTELLSQAYSKENNRFQTPPWMRVFTRETEDALSIQNYNKTGGVNIIDLANINSCAFIATQDLGRVHDDNTFEILGRFDNSDIRGCNLMVL
ncbi:Possible acyl protein synthase/acyl-CoA reductase-like protein [hydrothermal vent metagenome]|uniref:Possible acyl protein synthase/acyl-CoA reductase-like protein n=1 Tax=hydrothermal vent metagenome TaxID=652676 RepID=A0A3B0RMF1_9ZZZZ